MSNAFQFELVSPDQVVVSRSVESVVVPGTLGDFGVLADHAPLLSSLRPGVIRIIFEGGETDNYFVADGFADVNDNVCTVLAEDAEHLDHLNRDEIEAYIRDLEAKCEGTDCPDTEGYLRKEIQKYVAKLDACDCYK